MASRSRRPQSRRSITPSIVLLLVAAVCVAAFAAWVVVRDPAPPTSSVVTTSGETGPTVVFMGDSITEQLSKDNRASGGPSWATMLAFGPDSPWTFLGNVAIPGEETGEMLARFPGGVVDKHPTDVVILAGTNDAAHKVPVEQVKQNLGDMIELAEAADIKVTVVSPPPNNTYNDRVAAVVEAEQQVAAMAGVTFIDIFHGIGGPSGAWAPDETVDGTHPSSKGQRAIAANVLAAVR